MIIITNVNKFNAPRGAGMAQWSKHKPPPTWVRFLSPGSDSDSDSDSIRGLSLSWFSPSSEGFSPGSPVSPGIFLPPQKQTLQIPIRPRKGTRLKT